MNTKHFLISLAAACTAFAGCAKTPAADKEAVMASTEIPILASIDT